MHLQNMLNKAVPGWGGGDKIALPQGCNVSFREIVASIALILHWLVTVCDNVNSRILLKTDEPIAI